MQTLAVRLGRAILPPALYRIALELSESCRVFDAGYYAARYPESQSHGSAFAHYRRAGAAKGYAAHPLFDTAYYLEKNPDVRNSRWNPLLHYIAVGGHEGRNPHPLFDSKWYLDQYPDVRASKLNPLQHYLHFGAAELRNPHPLFDAAFYARSNPATGNQLLHYLETGGKQLRNPHPLFDARYYVKQNPEAAAGRWTPLEHFMRVGLQRNLRTHPGVTDLDFYAKLGAHTSSASAAPIRPLILAPRSAAKSPHVNPPVPERTTIPVLTVYGPPNVRFLSDMLIPALRSQRLPFRVSLELMNYSEPRALFQSEDGPLTIHDWSESREPGRLGFGEGINLLFDCAKPEHCFFVVNPDSFPMDGCLQHLLDAYVLKNAAIVEARQWPQEHPKEYDAATGHTPWAAGAFILMSSSAFRQLGGFDPVYFLYNEDVDLSWRAWLNDLPVVYQPAAICSHFTGLWSYRADRFYFEHFYSIRNFIAVAYKFFGEEGERRAMQWVKAAALPPGLLETILESYRIMRQNIRVYDGPAGPNASMVKILAMNIYHELRGV